MLQYFFTKYGDVYAGYRWDEMKYREYTIVIQGTKLKAYRELKQDDKTLETISKHGWVFPNTALVGTLDSDKFNPEKGQHNGDTWYGDYERKYLFIVGAGASAHCSFGSDKDEFYKDDLRPPLGTSLFEKRFKSYYSNYSGVKQALPYLQGTANPDIEALFEKEWQEIQGNNNQNLLSRHINIQYYLQEILRDVSTNTIENYYASNLYATLADKLQRIYNSSIKKIHNRTTSKKFAFISFNQDSILEHFVAEYFKRPIRSIKDYAEVNDSPYCIFKPHGSWNWGWEFPKDKIGQFNGNTPKWLFDNNINFFQLYYELLGDHVNMIDWATWGFESANHEHDLGKYTIDKSQLQLMQEDRINEYFPALLLPYRDKDEFTMPLRDFMNMETYLGYAETVVIIGWKGNEAAFNRLLLNHAHKINKVIIADPNADIVERNLEQILKKVPNGNVIKYKNFEDFVLNGVDKEII